MSAPFLFLPLKQEEKIIKNIFKKKVIADVNSSGCSDALLSGFLSTISHQIRHSFYCCPKSALDASSQKFLHTSESLLAKKNCTSQLFQKTGSFPQISWHLCLFFPLSNVLDEKKGVADVNILFGGGFRCVTPVEEHSGLCRLAPSLPTKL